MNDKNRLARIEKTKHLVALRDPLITLQRYLDQNILDFFVRFNIKDIEELIGNYVFSIESSGKGTGSFVDSLETHKVSYEYPKYRLYIGNKENTYGAYLPFKYLYEDFTPKHIMLLMLGYIIYHKIFLTIIEKDNYFSNQLRLFTQEYSKELANVFGGTDLRISFKDNLPTLADILSIFFQTKAVESVGDTLRVFDLLFSNPSSSKLQRMGKNNISLIGHASLGTIASFRHNNIVLNVLGKDFDGNFNFDENFWNFLFSYNLDERHGGCPASFTVSEHSHTISYYQDLHTQISGIESMLRTFHYIFLNVKNNYSDLATKSIHYRDDSYLRVNEKES